MKTKTIINIVLTVVALWIALTLWDTYQMWNAAGYPYGPMFP